MGDNITELTDIMFDATDAGDYVVDPTRGVDQSLADAFTAQVDTFYSLPRKRSPRTEIVFSPSGVTKCARELYYAHTGAPADETPLVPWRERMSRNGTGVHNVIQSDLYRMERALRETGHSARFRMLADEIKGEKSYMVGSRKVTLRGRADGRLGVLDGDGNVVEEIGFEIKTKDGRAKLNKIHKSGVQPEHRAQTVAYALIFGLTKFLFMYESLQKPNWGDVNPEKSDIYTELVEVKRDEAKQLLVRLAKVVDQIETRTLPAPELDKCGFCPFKTQCHADGGYSA